MSQHLRKPFEVAIIGGGIAGITLAISLLKRSVPCVIYEKAHRFGEVGAGLGISPNAIRAMKSCDPSIHDAFDKVSNGNIWESKKDVMFDFLDGMDDSTDLEPRFTIKSGVGLQGSHRGHFLNALLDVLPNNVACFNQCLDHTEEPQTNHSEKLRMFFRDGTVAEADTIIGYDGVKSRTRELLVGQDDPSAKCSYTHKYAYRGMIPMEQVVQLMGEERALNSSLWMGENMHLTTYPVAHGTICNLVAYRSSTKNWPSETQLTLPAREEIFLEDFKGFRPLLQKLIKMVRDLDQWAMFDLGDHPVPAFAKRRVCITGDAAHATTPHQGAGAGFCIEDAAVLASLLADEKVKTTSDIQAAFAAFDSSRRERSQWLVQSCRRAGDLYDLQTEVGNHFETMAEELRQSMAIIWNYSIEDAIRDAVDDLGKRLATESENKRN
ncbi:hypothetical protein FZEAL_869 [Fusarium zealandicum]|uniref:FAD-binding domain-containing protein n=1 Tax=Fusarium zealandicum TaxID=1053134 RepID=A0A8H4UU23_9HYPO|nr:hypothetical protein FZEAL_869 [Fusarium zealandicum]